MIRKLYPDAVEEAKRHALDEYPKESCGLICGNKYYRCKNIADNPYNNFRISEQEQLSKLRYGNIKCVIHSHNNYPHCSKSDQYYQKSSGYPFGIINIFNHRIDDIWFWGDDNNPDPLIGRKFRNGSHDCYALARDWYIVNRGIVLPTRPHRFTWFKDKLDEGGNIIDPKINLIVDNVINFGFKFVGVNDKFEIGDVLMARHMSEVINHTAIYVGKGLILHHLDHRLSRMEPLILYKNKIEKAARYNA